VLGKKQGNKVRQQLLLVATAVLMGWIPAGVPAAGETAPAGTSPAGQLFGVHEFSVAGRAGEPDRVSLLRAVGAQVLRLPVTWHLMEGDAKGRTADWFWQELDAEVAAAERAGVKLVITLAQTPCWASSDPRKDCVKEQDFLYLHYRPNDVNDYADAIARLAARYGSRVYAWELWNEPNYVGNWRWPECGGTGDTRGICKRPSASNDDYGSFVALEGARQYAALVRASYARIKSVAPEAIVLAGSLAGGDVDYLKEMYGAGVEGHFSALSLHPYTATYPVNRFDWRYGRNYDPDECFSGTTNSRFWCFKQGVEAVRQAMLTQGDAVPIWFTEFGFSSTNVWNGSGLDGQAAQLSKAISLIRNWDFVPVACWYQLLDQQGADHRESRFGLFDTALNLKPAGRAFKEAVTLGKPVLLAPAGAISTNMPTFVWQSVPGAVRYTLSVNEQDTPKLPGKVGMEVTPEQAGCPLEGTCRYSPGVVFAAASAEWWVTAQSASGASSLSDGMVFSMSAVNRGAPRRPPSPGQGR
jgi:hypothetical protein